MTRERLEERQVWFYMAAVTAGVGLGVWQRPEIPDALIFAPLGLLLYATFVQVPTTHLREALQDRRYLSAALLANFVVVPVVVWLLGWLVSDEPAILLGLYIVLLVPCTDWFMVFSHLGRGDTKLAITSTPVMLLVQFLLLPVYLWLFLGRTFSDVIRAGPFVEVFALLIVIPLLASAATQAWAERRKEATRVMYRLSWVPVPCLAVVLFLIAISQAGQVVNDLRNMERVVLTFVLYLFLAAPIGLLTGRCFRLSPPATRTLVFSVGTRNSFVVLPFALALPAGWEAALPVVVLQPLIELLGMMVYLHWMRRQ